MTGLVKAKNYDWQDSNLALFGTDTDRNVKKESAETEPAWKGAGQKVGLQIWRIVKFKVEHWPREDYGKFYNGDSYIILNTYKDKESDELLYDVHFWIGQNSTQDEYGTAAYKTVELDTLLDDKPIQHREVQGHESKTFKKYFPRLEHWKGGADTGFNHVEPEKYEPRLLHVRKEGRKVTIKEVTLCQKNLKKEDAYVIDCGMKIFQWNGVNAHMNEKYEAGQYTIQLRSARGGKPTLDVLDDQEDGEISESVAETGVFDNAAEPDDDPAPEDDKSGESALIKLSDASGKLEFEEIVSGSLRGKRQQLKSKDVFMVYTGTHLFVWIGGRCSKSEKQNSMSYAHDYLQKVGNPLLSVTALSEGQKNEDFDDVWR